MQRIVLLLLILLASGSALAATYGVYPDGSGTYPNIQAAVNACVDGDRVVLMPGTYTGSGNTDVVVWRNITIRANDGLGSVVIDCEQTPRAFVLEYSDAVIEGLIIRNGAYTRGGAVSVEAGSPTFTDCTFEDNTATLEGGAMHIYSEAQVTLDHCTFARNHCDGQGGAICVREWSSLDISRSTFVINGADQGGHIYLLEESDLSLETSILAYSYDGAAVMGYYNGTTTASCIDVYGNRGGDWVDTLMGLLGGGNFHVEPMFIDPVEGDYRLHPLSAAWMPGSCGVIGAANAVASAYDEVVYELKPDGLGMFEDLESAMDAVPSQAVIALKDGLYAGDGYQDLDPQGKAMTIRSRSGVAENCTIDAEGYYGGFARVFQLDGDDDASFRVEGLRLTGGYADENGGLVYAAGGCGAVFADCIFDGGVADFGNAVSVMGDETTLSTVSFTGCTFTESLQGWYWTPSLSYCQFLDEEAQVHLRFCQDGLIHHCLFEGLEDRQGGAMKVRYGAGTLRVQSSDFVNCRAAATVPDYPIHGGALYLYDPGNVIISGCDFTDCHADSLGGDIYAHDHGTGATLTIETSHFSRGEELTSLKGGSLYAKGFTLDMQESTWNGYHSSEEGGALAILNGDLDLLECGFDDCASYEGGAIHMVGGSIGMEDSAFRNNTSYYLGGAINLWGGTILASNCLFEGNRSDSHDGTIAMFDCPENHASTFNYCVFRNNYANHDGAVLGFGFTGYPQRAEFRMCTFHANDTNPEYNNNAQVYLLYNDEVDFYHCLISGSNSIPVVGDTDGCSATSYCSNIHGNAPGNWVGLLEGQLGDDENFSADPLFCGAEEGILTLREDSPCLPDNNACVAQIGALGEGCSVPSSVDDTPLLADGILRGAYPNPFNPQTTIAYELPQEAAVTLVVHDVSGRVVRTLRGGVMESAGSHDVVWNGRDDAGRQVGSGVYLVRLAADGVSQVKRVALIK